jgi:hypothetical protein
VLQLDIGAPFRRRDARTDDGARRPLGSRRSSRLPVLGRGGLCCPSASDPRERRIQELEKQVQRRCQHSFQHHRLESLNEPGRELPPALHLGQLLFSQPPFEQRLC